MSNGSVLVGKIRGLMSRAWEVIQRFLGSVFTLYGVVTMGLCALILHTPIWFVVQVLGWGSLIGLLVGLGFTFYGLFEAVGKKGETE